MYISGHSLVIYNLEAKTQRFISGTAESVCITAIALAPSGKHLAVAEKNDKGTVTVYDLLTLKRRKVLALSDSASKVIALLYSGNQAYPTEDILPWFAFVLHSQFYPLHSPSSSQTVLSNHSDRKRYVKQLKTKTGDRLLA